MIRKIITALAALLLCTAFYVLAVLADPVREKDNSKWLVKENTEINTVSRAESANQSELAGLLGVAVPRLPGDGQGQVEDASYRGIRARLYSYRTDRGTVSAVRPADAAPLLLQNRYSLTGQSVALLGMQAALATSGTSRCLYFAGDDAAYCLTADGMSEDDFLLLAGELAF